MKLFNNIRKTLVNEGKTTSYLKYAIGEIVLVVVGILIALTVNNWNEKLKQNKSRINYTKSLITDLEKDSLQLIDENLKLRNRLDNLRKLKQRLSSPLANMDTLNHIIEYEHDPSFVAYSHTNRNTFSILTSTGNLEFFEAKNTEAIQNYYQEATDNENFHEGQLNFYRNLFVQYLTNVPLPNRHKAHPFDLIEQERLEKELWQEADIKRVHAIFRGQTSMQLNLFAAFESENEQLLKLNHELIIQLKESLK